MQSRQRGLSGSSSGSSNPTENTEVTSADVSGAEDHSADSNAPDASQDGPDLADGAEATIENDTQRVRRDGAGKLRRGTDTAVKSPGALNTTALLDDDENIKQHKLRVQAIESARAVALQAASASATSDAPAAIAMPDKTAAMPSIPDSDGNAPFDPEAEVRAASEAALRAAGIQPRRYTSDRPATAEALHEEDEDGPTMVAPIPKEIANRPPPRPGPPQNDEEQTQVHPYRLPQQPVTQPPPPLESSQISIPPMSRPPQSLPQPREMFPTSPPPVTHVTMDTTGPPPTGQNSFDAMVMPLEAKLMAERKARAYDTFAASILGVGMIVAALASYLAAGVPEKTSGYFGVITLTAVSMFLVGMGPIQQRNETKLTFIALGGVMLGFTLIRLMFVAI